MSKMLRMTEEEFAKRGVSIARVDGNGKVGAFKPNPTLPKPSKFRNVKTEVDGIKFDSKKEARRWSELKFAEGRGEIRSLRRQVKYALIPAQERADGTKERGVDYVADFVYDDVSEPPFEIEIIEDAKGMRTPDYIIKRKLMLWVHGITVQEV